MIKSLFLIQKQKIHDAIIAEQYEETNRLYHTIPCLSAQEINDVFEKLHREPDLRLRLNEYFFVEVRNIAHRHL